jgi:hypothetical protein
MCTKVLGKKSGIKPEVGSGLKICPAAESMRNVPKIPLVIDFAINVVFFN